MSAAATPVKSKRAYLAPLLEAGGLWLLILLAGVLLIAGLLNNLQRKELRALERAQLELTLLEIEAGLELDLSQGLDLDNNRHIQPLLENSLEKNPHLYSIDVLDRFGQTILSTDKGTVGEFLPPTALAAAQQASSEFIGRQVQTWHSKIGDAPIMGIVLNGAFDEVIGHVIVTYASHITVRPAESALVTSLLITVLATTIAGIAAIWLATHAQRQLLQEQAAGRLHQAHSQIHAARQRLHNGATRLDEVESIE